MLRVLRAQRRIARVQLTPGLNVADRFQLVRELGRGGMGSVWLAEHTRLDALCAIKFIDTDRRNRPEVRKRFQREAKAAAQLRSPHVVQILDYGVWENIPYIAMEYLEGEDLAHRLHRVGKLSLSETCRIACHVAKALSKAHSAGIVHRDIKPENIFLVRDDDSEVAKVLDFGIAQDATNLDDGATADSRSILGTPFYMSPEQARGMKRLDQRSDLFSLAVIVYQCLTGELPFSGDGVREVFIRIVEAPLPVPSQRAADLPPSFDAWWQRAAARDIERRFQTAKEFAEALALALRISDMLEITAQLPAAALRGYTGRLSLMGNATLAPGASPPDAGPTLALYETGEDSFARTFEPELTARRRKTLRLAGAAAAVVLFTGAFLLSRENAPSTKSAALGSAHQTRAPGANAAVLPPAEPSPQAEPSIVASSDKRNAVAPLAASARLPAKAVDPRGSPRKAKTPKPVAVKPPDFGI